MDERRFTQKPWVYLFFWIVLCGGIFAWQISKLGGFMANLGYIFVDAIIFGFGFYIWLAFFAQFVLPVRTLRERQQIFDRLLTHLSGWRGPAIFVRDGKQIKRIGEEKRKGPGVIWLDSASAAVTRKAASFKKTIGPGVHFTWKGEYIASTVDLHPQAQGLGPRESEDPFASQKEGQSDDEYNQIQKRRMEVSAWTRDGIEIVPNIKVVFKINASPAKGDQKGSRFGFNADSVRRAIIGEGVNPGAPSGASRHRAAWNQLPALIAVDLWREYLSKFTLAELFEASQPTTKPKPAGPDPEPDDTQALSEPVTPSSGFEKAIAGILHETNLILARWADKWEKPGKKSVKSATPAPKTTTTEKEVLRRETALQTINRMVAARLTEAEVKILDDNGKPGCGSFKSPEYELLEKRGLKVTVTGVNNLRFPKDVENQLVSQWKSSWLISANKERKRIDRQRGFMELSSQVQTVLKYALSLSKDLLRHKPATQKETLKTLMLRSRDELIKNDRLHSLASMERKELERLIQWVEGDGS